MLVVVGASQIRIERLSHVRQVAVQCDHLVEVSGRGALSQHGEDDLPQRSSVARLGTRTLYNIDPVCANETTPYILLLL